MNPTDPPTGTQPTAVFQAPTPGAASTQPPPAAPPVQPVPQVQPAAPLPPSPTGGMVLPPQTPIPPSPPGDKKKFIFIGVGILLVIVILFFVVRLILSASGPKKEEMANLEYWGVYEDQKVMQVLINDFERDHPNIKVKFVPRDAKQYRDTLLTRIKNGNGPDIFRYHNSWVPMLKNVLLPLTAEAVTPEEYKKTYYPVIQNDLVVNGGILGVPLSIDTLALYINDQLFSSQNLKPPENWDQFAIDAAALTTRIEEGENQGEITTAGAAFGTYDNITHAPDIISLLLVQGRVDLRKMTEDQSLKPTQGCTYRACDSLKYYTVFAKGGDVIQKIWDGTLDRSVVSFANGRVGMYFGYSWDIFAIRSINPSLAFSIHPVPNLSGEKKTIASYWVEGVSNKTKFPQASMEFMKYLNSKDTQQKFFTENAKVQGLGSPYARRDLAGSLKNDPLLFPFVEQAPYAVSTPFVADTQDNGLNDVLNGYLKNTVAEISGNTSPDTAIDTLQQGINQAYSQYER